MKLAADLTDRATIQRHPRKNLPNNLGVSLDNFVACLASSFVLPNVAITVRRAAEDVNCPGLRRVPLPATAPFKDLGTFIFCDHSLDLEQQILLGRPADVMIEEDDLHTLPLKFLHQEHLIRIIPGKAIRRVDVDSIEATGRRLVAQSFQSRTKKRAAAVALINEAQFGLQPKPIGLNASL